MADPPDRLTAALADRYAIERELGAGGMATVYLARDLKHDRQVAVKVLRPELTAVLGAERFLKEITTTANLQHPHILPLFDSGEADAFLYYVMPFIDGETLRDKLDRETQLGIDEAVRIAGDVADALDYAHRHNVIHRDIKPENILLHDGRPVVADFGIALAVSAAAGGRMTETGLSLGTPHYMSPEQATAEKDLTARSDVYSLGSVLYEMLAGSPPHVGASAQQVIMKILTEEAAPVTDLRKSVPANVAAAIAKSLDKLPADRFDTAKAFGEALIDPHFEGAGVVVTRTASNAETSGRLTTVLAAALGVMTLTAGWALLKSGSESVKQPPTRLAVVAPGVMGSGSGFGRQIALTPDGRTLVYTAMVDGVKRTFRHHLDQAAGEVMTNVPDNATAFALSQDGRYVFGNVTGYDGYRFPLDGGTVRPLPEGIPGTYSVAWTSDGSLWMSAETDIDRGIALVTSENVLTRPFGTDFHEHSMMQVLPGDRTALTILRPKGTNSGAAYLLDLVDGEATQLIDAAIAAIRYTAGLLVYVLSDGTMEAVRFELSSQDVVGTAVRVATGVTLSGIGQADFAVADNGTVAYIPAEPGSLILMDRNGESRLAHEDARNFHAPQFSPDGSRIATDFDTIDGRDVWVLELAGGTLTRVTFDRDGHDAVWEPNGRFLTYTSFRPGGMGIYRILPGGTEPAELLLESPVLGYTGIWLRDGSALVSAGQSLASGSQQDIVIVRNGGAGPVEPLVATRFQELHPAVSPDNQWIAFNSNQSGSQEVYVRPLEGPGEQVRVSVSGGVEPLWGPDGRELFFRAGGELMVAAIDTHAGPTVSARRALFSVADISASNPHTNYDISPDGNTFAMVRLKSSSRIMIIQNLPELVREMDGGPEVGR